MSFETFRRGADYLFDNEFYVTNGMVQEAVELFDQDQFQAAFMRLDEAFKSTQKTRFVKEKFERLSSTILKSKSKYFFILSAYFILRFGYVADASLIKPHLDKIGQLNVEVTESAAYDFVTSFKDYSYLLLTHYTNDRDHRTLPVYDALIACLIRDAAYNANKSPTPYKWNEGVINRMQFEHINNNQILKHKLRISGNGCKALVSCIQFATRRNSMTIDAYGFKRLYEELIEFREQQPSPTPSPREFGSAAIPVMANDRDVNGAASSLANNVVQHDNGSMDIDKARLQEKDSINTDTIERNDNLSRDVDEEQKKNEVNDQKVNPDEAKQIINDNGNNDMEVDKMKDLEKVNEQNLPPIAPRPKSGDFQYPNPNKGRLNQIDDDRNKDKKIIRRQTTEGFDKNYVILMESIVNFLRLQIGRSYDEKQIWVMILNSLIIYCAGDRAAKFQYATALELIFRGLYHEDEKQEMLYTILQSPQEIQRILTEHPNLNILQILQRLPYPVQNYPALTKFTWQHYVNSGNTTYVTFSIDPTLLFANAEDAETVLYPIEVAIRHRSWKNVAIAALVDMSKLNTAERQKVEELLPNLVADINFDSRAEWTSAIVHFCDNSYMPSFQSITIVRLLCLRNFHHLSSQVGNKNLLNLRKKYPDIEKTMIDYCVRHVNPANNDGEIPLWFIEYVRNIPDDQQIPDKLLDVFERIHAFYVGIEDGTVSIRAVKTWTNYKRMWRDVTHFIRQKYSAERFDQVLKDYEMRYNQELDTIRVLKDAKSFFQQNGQYLNGDPWQIDEHPASLQIARNLVNKFKEDMGFVGRYVHDFDTFMFFVRKRSQLLKGALKMQEPTTPITYAEHINQAITFLGQMIGSNQDNGFRLSDLSKINELLKDFSKSAIDIELSIVDEHLGQQGKRMSKRGFMIAALDLSICKQYINDIIKYHNMFAAKLNERHQITVAAEFTECAQKLESWSQRYENPLLSEADNALSSLFKILPQLTVHMVPIYAYLLESENLVEFIINRVGQNDEDFQRTITMLRGNLQDDERAATILSSLQISKEILSSTRLEFMDETQIENITLEEVMNHIKNYYARDSEFANLKNSIHHVDDAKAYLDQLRNDDTQSLIVRIWSQQDKCIVEYSNGQEYELDEVLQKVNYSLSSYEKPALDTHLHSTANSSASSAPASASVSTSTLAFDPDLASTSAFAPSAPPADEVVNKNDASYKELLRKKELLETCREGHRLWATLMSISYPTDDDKYVFFSLSTYKPAKALNEYVNDKLDENERKAASEKERLRKSWHLLSNLSITSFMKVKASTADEDIDIVREALIECLDIDDDQLEYDIDLTSMSENANATGLDLLLAALKDVEKKMVDDEISKSLIKIEELKHKNEDWLRKVRDNSEYSPRIHLLSNRQLKFVLSNDLLSMNSSFKFFGYVCGVNVTDKNGGKLSLEDVATQLKRGDQHAGQEELEQTKIVNLGYVEGERLPVTLFRTLLQLGEKTTSANVFWCNGSNSPTDIENFLRRPGAVPDLTFVVVRPDRLSLSSRRHLMHLLSGSELTGGTVHLLFSDHEVEAAISKALRCERSDLRQGQGRVEELIPTLIESSQIMGNKAQQEIICVHGNTGDGKTTWIQDRMSQIRGSTPLRISVNEKFTSDSCSRLIINHIRKHSVIQTNGLSLVLHFDIADGESITDPIAFFWKVMRDKEYLDRSTIRPLEELEKFVFQFFILGFLIDDVIGDVMCLPPTTKVYGYFELPSVDMLHRHLHILRGLSRIDVEAAKGSIINVSDPNSRRPYISKDRDDDFAAYCLQLLESNRTEVTSLCDGVARWEKSLLENTLHMEGALDANNVNRLIESKMPGWDRRSQRNVCSLLATRMSLLGRSMIFYLKESDEQAIRDQTPKIAQLGNLILESGLRKFDVRGDHDEKHLNHVVLGGDGQRGASYDIVQLRPPGEIEIDFYEEYKAIDENDADKKDETTSFLSKMQPARLRSIIAPALGLGGHSHVIVKELERQQYALTPDFALKLLNQCEYRDARSVIVYCGGTGVGKSEGAKLQSQLGLAEGYFDVAGEARQMITRMFLRDDFSQGEGFVENLNQFTTIQSFCAGFRTANIDLGQADAWDVKICRNNIQLNVPSVCLLLLPVTVGGCRPLEIYNPHKRKLVEAHCNNPNVKLSVHDNGRNCFCVKATATTEGVFNINVSILGVRIHNDCQVYASDVAPNSNEEPPEYTEGMKTTMKDISNAFANAADHMQNIQDLERVKVKEECTLLIRKWLVGWIIEHALVCRDSGKFSTLQRLDMIDYDNPDECLKELGKFGDNLRRTDLTFKICIHPSTTIEQLRRLVGRAVYRLAHMLEWLYSKRQDENFSLAQMRKVAVVFFDELNTSSFPGVMKQLMLDRMLDNKTLVDLGKEERDRIVELAEKGKFIDSYMSEDCFGPNEYNVINGRFFELAADGILFIGAINPPRTERRNAESTDRVDVLTQQRDDAVFNVTDLPEGLKRTVREFGDQDDIAMRDVVFNILSNIKYMAENERKDCCRLVMLSHRLITSYRKGKNNDGTFTKYDGTRIPVIQEMENTHSSIRNIWRTVKIANFFIDHPKLLYLKHEKVNDQLLNVRVKLPNGIEIRRRAFLTALGSAYYLQLLKIDNPSIDLREDFGERIDNSYVLTKVWKRDDHDDGIPAALLNGSNFETFMDKSINSVFEHSQVLLSEEHAQTTVLKEHIFSILICTQLKIPILIVGPPGCSKTLCYQLVASGFKTLYSIDKNFPGFDFKCLEETVYQCSELSTAQDIEKILRNAVDYTGKRDRTHPVVLLDEASLAPRALKAIHEPFDQSNIACVVLSNLQLDAAKTNRCLYLRRKGFGDEFEDLKLLAISSTRLKVIENDLDSSKNAAILEGICKAYLKLVKGAFNSTFHLRHFLYCVRYLAPFGHPLDTTPQTIAKAISRNFGGLPQQQFEENIAKTFFEEIRKRLNEAGFRGETVDDYVYPPKSWNYDSVDIIEESIKGTREECGKQGFDPNIHAPRNVMLVVRGDGSGLLDMVLDKIILNETKSITVSSFLGDDDNVGREKAIANISREMTNGNIIRLYNGEKGRVFSAFYDAFNMRFAKAGTSWYVTIGSRSISRQYNPRFRAVVVIDHVEYDRMRSENSNMLPLLSRFEAHHVSPSSILYSGLAISRLRNGSNPTNDHFGWIQSAVDRTFDLLTQGSGCFVGVSGIGQDALDTAISLVLTSSTIASDDIGKNEAHEMVRAANRRLMQTGRPDALCLRTRTKWLFSEIIRDYVVNQEHFSLARFLDKTKDKFNFVLMRSTIELTSSELLRKYCPDRGTILQLDKFDHAEKFELELKDLLKNDFEPLLIVVNFSTTSSEQLHHCFRIIEENTRYEEERGRIVVLAHLSSDRFELGQIPNAKFTMRWNTVFVESIGELKSVNRDEELTKLLLYAFKIHEDENPTALLDPNNIKGDFIEELKSACKKIKVTRPIARERTKLKDNQLSNPALIRDPSNFVNAVYNDSQHSRLSKSRNDGFFLGSNTSAHELFVQCCKKVIGKLPEYKHVEIVTERAAMSTIGGNDGDSFEKTVTEAKQVFRNDSVCSLLVEILRDGGLKSFLDAAGGDQALQNKVAFDENDPKVLLTLLGATLLKEFKSDLLFVGVPPHGFIPKTPFFSLILQRVKSYLRTQRFNPNYLKEADPELFEVIEYIAQNDSLFKIFQDDLIQQVSGMEFSSSLELTISRMAIQKNFAIPDQRNADENVDDLQIKDDENNKNEGFDIYRVLSFILQQSGISEQCRKFVRNCQPLLEFSEQAKGFEQELEKYQGEDLMTVLYDKIYTCIKDNFINNDVNCVVRSLRAIRVVMTLSKSDSDCLLQVKRLCNVQESSMIHFLCAYTTYCSLAELMNDARLMQLVQSFYPKKDDPSPLLKQFGVSLKTVIEDKSKFWMAVEEIAFILADFDEGFFQPSGNCEQLLVLIQFCKWTEEGKLMGNRESFIMRTIYADIAKDENLRNHFSARASAVLQKLKTNFISPFKRGGENLAKANLEDSYYWMSYEDENRDICSLGELLQSRRDDPSIRIRLEAAKDKIIAKIADHMNKEGKWNVYLDFQCKSRACQKINVHLQIARDHLFVGEEGFVNARMLLGHLRTDIAENLLRQSPAILNNYGLSCLIDHRIQGNKLKQDDYKNLLKLPFVRGGNSDDQSIQECKDFGEFKTAFDACIVSGKLDAFLQHINLARDEKRIHNMRAFLLVLLHEFGLTKRQNIAQLFVNDQVCTKLIINPEERKWYEALGGDLTHFPMNPLPSVRNDDLPASYTQQHKQLKAMSVPLYYLACEPTSPMGSLYLAILSTVFGAPRERNHLWFRVFDIHQTRRNIGGPMFRDYIAHADVDCAYDLENAAVDVFTNIDDRNLHKCHVGSVAWGCNALACALITNRTDNLIQGVRSICYFHGDQQTSAGMDPELVRIAGDNEFAWRNMYLHIRSANFLEILQRNMDAPNVNPGMKSWPMDLTGAFSINVLDRYRQKMLEVATFLPSFATIEALRQYETSLTEILLEVEGNSPRIVTSIKEYGSAQEAVKFLISAQEYVNSIKVQNPYRYGRYEPIRRFLESVMNANEFNNKPYGHVLDYVHRYKGGVKAMQVMGEHGAKLYDIYRFCCERLSGRLCVGNTDPRYSDSALLTDVLNAYADEESDKGNQDIANIARKNAVDIVTHFDALREVADVMASIDCQRTPRPVGDVLLAGDALGGVPESENKSGWIVRTLVDVGKAYSKIAEIAEDDKDLLWNWDSRYGIAHNNYTQTRNLVTSTAAYNITEFDCFVELHLPKDSTFREGDIGNIERVLNAIIEINRKIINAVGGGLSQVIRWDEKDLIHPISWRTFANDVNDDDENDDDAASVEMDLEEEKSRRERIDMLDTVGMRLAKLSGYHHQVSGNYIIEILRMDRIPEEFERKVRRFLESKDDTGRVNAYIFCPRLVTACEQCTPANSEENMRDYVQEWPDDIPIKIKFLWNVGRICVEIILSRNSRFSDLDVVLQSGLVRDGAKLRHDLLINISKAEASKILQVVRQLAQYLYEERILTALADDSRRKIRNVLKDVFPFFECSEKLLPEYIDGSCLADYLLLLHDIASKLRLRSVKFGIVTSAKQNQQGAGYSDEPLEPKNLKQYDFNAGFNEERLDDQPPEIDTGNDTFILSEEGEKMIQQLENTMNVAEKESDLDAF